MKRNTFEIICSKINWSELAEQKKVITSLEKEQTDFVLDISNDRISRRKAVKKAKALQDLFKFIEKLQDAATDEYGVSLERVHPIVTRVKLINQWKKNIN